MKGLSHWLLSLSALALLGLNLHLWQGERPRNLNNPDQLSHELAQMAPDKPLAEGTNAEAAIPTPDAQPNSPPVNFNWAAVETTDYKEYAKRLRALGFPNELVREIIVADVNKLYEPREQALTKKLVPYDAPMSQRQSSDISPDDWQRVRDLWALRVEKQRLLESILGEYVPREVLRTLISRNYEAYDYALSQLPPEKREPVQWAQETEIYTEGYNKVTIADHAAELESFKRTRAERDEAILQALTPEEFERYEMNTTPAGTELARRVIGMQPSDQEFDTMFRIAYTNWMATGGVYGRWRANYVPPDQIAAADQVMNQAMAQALGPDRYLDYQMAISGTGQQMRNFAARFDLPRETMAQAFQLQTQLDGLNRRFQGVSGDPPAVSDPRQQLQLQLQQLLGPDLWQVWNVGRNLRVSLDP